MHSPESPPPDSELPELDPETHEVAAAVAPPPPGGFPVWARLLTLAALLAGAGVLGHLSGLDQLLGDQERLQAAVAAAGPWGALLIVAAFTLGLFIQVPGVVFALAAIYCYGPLWGGLLAHASAVIACQAVFSSVRAVGGQPLGQIERPWVRAVLARIEERPLRTVTLLRLVFWSSPQLNYALALTPVRAREHLLGTALGLVPIKIVVALGGQSLIDYAGSLFGG